EALAVEGRSDRADLAVHHARGGNHVGAGSRLRDGDLLVEPERRIIGGGLPLEHAAVPVVGVLAKTEVRNQQRVRAECISQLAQRPLADAVLGPCLRALRILLRRNAKEHETAHADLECCLRFARQGLERVLLLPGHRLDRAWLIDRVAHEQWMDQILRRDRGLPGEPAERRPRPQPAGALRWKGHAGIGVRLRTMASTSPPVVYSCAMISTRSPRSRAVCAVIGPMQAILTWSPSAPGIASTK